MNLSSKNILIQAILNQVEKVRLLSKDPDVLPDLLVHELRKSFKRLVAFLKFYPDEMNDIVSEHSKAIKTVARQLTHARESAVNLVLADRLLVPQLKLEEAMQNQLRDIFEAENRLAVQQLFEESGILKQIAELMQTIEKNLLPKLAEKNLPIQFPVQLTSSYLKAFEHFSQVQGSYDPVQYHELRKLLKTLYYQFEVATAGNEEAMLAESERLDKLTELLGEDHDWHIFQAELSKDIFSLSKSQRVVVEQKIQLFQEANFRDLKQGLENFFLDSSNNFLDKLSAFPS